MLHSFHKLFAETLSSQFVFFPGEELTLAEPRPISN